MREFSIKGFRNPNLSEGAHSESDIEPEKKQEQADVKTMLAEVINMGYSDEVPGDQETRIDQFLEQLPKIKRVLIETFQVRKFILYDIVGIAKGRAYSEDESKYNKIREFGLEIIAELASEIVEAIKEVGLTALTHEALKLLAQSSDSAQRQVGIDSLFAVIDKIENGFLDKDYPYNEFESLELIHNWGSDEQIMEIGEVAIRTAEKLRDKASYGKIITYLIGNNPIEIIGKGYGELITFLESHDLPIGIATLWEKSTPDLGLVIDKNVSTIIELERQQPGICHILHDEFGIANFGRYPINLLISQYKEISNLENPYGVIIYPQNDWNGAFYENTDTFDKLYKDLEGEFSLRVFECDGKIDVARALVKLNRKYNPPESNGHKISLAIIGGHGSEDSIRFGGNKPRNALTSNDLAGKGVQRTSEFFDDEPTFILASCSTGADQGIGQKLSKAMNAKVIAPKIPSGVKEIKVGRRPGGKFRFNAVFNTSKEEEDEKKIKKVYVMGTEKESK